MPCSTHILQILFFKMLLLLLFSSPFLFSHPLLESGLIWTRVEEEDFSEMNSHSLVQAVIPQGFESSGNSWF